jgi:GxxExxY protein
MELTETIIASIIRVHRALGPGFVESIYRRALALDLRNHSLNISCEKDVSVFYEGVEVGRHRLDLIVEDLVIVEVKHVRELCQAHYAQVRSYLRATNLEIALLVNFAKERADFRRVRCAIR